MEELDELAREAGELARPLNGLDPTTFPSIAAMERDIVGFMRRTLHGTGSGLLRSPVVGSVTSGGTESCLLAVKTARDLWRAEHPELARRLAREGRRPRLVTTTLVHAAFQKAAKLFDLEWDPVPCEPDGTAPASRIVDRLDDDVALVVVSAPTYPSGIIDPIAEVSAAARRLGISCHVDACFGGLALPWWPRVEPWDFRLRGVTSISADLHKFGYAPKGVSVLLHRGRRRHRAQFFATTSWAGYPVVNPTLLGSRSASPLASAWAITKRLGHEGYASLTSSCARSVTQITQAVASIPGLTIWGNPTGPALALIADESLPAHEWVDPHHLADEMVRHGFRIQHQPGSTQPDGARLPHSAHLTITPVTERALPEFLAALEQAADAVRGTPRAEARLELAALTALGFAPRSVGGRFRMPSPSVAWLILRVAGVNPGADSLPGRLAPLMTLVERLPAPVAEALLTELLARVSEP
ncbi:aspartate aminotransferase family protein [Leucobacter denitrificans]|uniref:Aspartate aminotransferase family protein n=2 Tax=Leucobacter denitrificans TaxID=683042 RepID=A0A7G9S7R8_9MICO|nr:aspartate aminotransferase family protein [Leucobacter denitrificans]